MWNRNRVGVTVILLSLLLDSFIINHQKTGDAAAAAGCYPARELYKNKVIEGIKYDIARDTISKPGVIDRKNRLTNDRRGEK